MDWADRLIAKARKRGDEYPTAERLREDVRHQCESNIERWNGEREYRKEPRWTDAEKQAATEKETRRLIKLRREDDKRQQLRFDYRQKGVEIEPDYSQIGKVGSVRLPFTAEEWADLLNKEGEHLGACCADISRIRDILQGACRNDHFVDVEDFYEAVYLAKHHGFKIGDDPIGRMIALWGKIKDDVRVRRTDDSTNTESPNDALETLYSAAGVICWDNLYSRDNETKDTTFDRHMNRSYALATVQVAVRTLFFKLKEMDPGAIEGYGLVRQDGEIGKTRRGLAVFRTETLAQEICDNWNKAQQEDNRGKKRKREPYVYSIKKVRVSMEKGFEILPDDYQIQVTEDVDNAPQEPKPIRL